MKLAKKLSLFFISLIISLLTSSLLNAGTEVGNGLTIDGQIRERTEFIDKSFYDEDEMYERSFLRTRLGLSYTRIENTKLYVQIQDSRVLGMNSSDLTNDFNLGIHQAYIKFKCRKNNSLWMQAGRFEVAYGRQRVLGAVGWSNVGRTFDGFRAGYVGDNVKLDLFLLKIDERYYNYYEFPYLDYYLYDENDQVLYGLYIKLLEDHLHLFGLYDYDHLELTNEAGDLKPRLSRWTFGGHYNRTMKSGFDVVLDLALQSGSYYYADISAYMFAGEFGYMFEHEMNPRAAFGFDITSGDDGTEADEINTYDNLYYTGHAFRGYMDYFIGSPPEGLMDLVGRFKFNPAPDWTAAVDAHLFRTMEEHIVPGTSGEETSNAIGQEIDVTVKRAIYSGLAAQLGASMFFPSDDWYPDGSTATWFYFMLTADIK